jgi:hypothetical protein
MQGIILNTVDNPNGYLIAFGNQPHDFYLVSYDLVWTGGEAGDCIQVIGKIDQIGNSPIMLFGWNNLPQVCP